MSTASTQYHMPSEYEDEAPLSYDPQFTAEISNKMQVPDRIQMHPQPQSGYPTYQENNEDPHRDVRHAMKVPDRIVIAGHNQHIGMKQEPRPLDLDVLTQTDQTSHYVGLTTPPRVLTVEESGFPIIEEEEEEEREEGGTGDHGSRSHNTTLMLDMSAQGQHTLDALQVPPYSPGGINDSLVELEEEDERIVLRRHVTKLTRRIMQLENSDQRRVQREIIYCSLASLYLVWKIWSWMKNGR
ncbi:mitochondrial fission factor [Lingula anatina]|uniref:Mitochondrial fission factor n=1 Tax=Lingula anatina TaxID=7574 RepID=A0A1S3I9Z4_LINAN|nr:mitochondrial fission factor [Lingula anatina]XP_013395078.1 mitochondrial fission factor [Lingula anatina]|eukprot:XP_013395077.1 mitochondrial fission factor [Lingula anatina]